MHIIDALGRCSITIEHLVDDTGYDGFLFEASVDIGHGLFKARNADVQFLNLHEFVADLDAFCSGELRRPRLNGTYDSYLEISGTAKNVAVRFGIGDFFAGYQDVASSFILSGAFQVDRDLLPAMLEKFHDLLEPWSGRG